MGYNSSAEPKHHDIEMPPEFIEEGGAGEFIEEMKTDEFEFDDENDEIVYE